jgi:hypothetical protein
VTCKVTHQLSDGITVGWKGDPPSMVVSPAWVPSDTNPEYVMEFKGKSAKTVWDYPDCYFELEVNGTEGTLSAWRGGQDGFHLVRRGMLTLQFCET